MRNQMLPFIFVACFGFASSSIADNVKPTICGSWVNGTSDSCEIGGVNDVNRKYTIIASASDLPASLQLVIFGQRADAKGHPRVIKNCGNTQSCKFNVWSNDKAKWNFWSAVTNGQKYANSNPMVVKWEEKKWPSQPELWLDGKYYATKDTLYKHMPVTVGKPLAFEVRWRGKPLTGSGCFVTMRDGARYLAFNSYGFICDKGTTCKFYDKQTSSLPTRNYYAELHCPVMKTVSTYKDNRILIDWLEQFDVTKHPVASLTKK